LHFHTTLDNHDPTLPGAENIIHCVDAFETATNAFLVLEYCDLGDLYENILQGRIPRDTQTVKDMMLQLVDAVTYCHAAGVYHRDIKPENILMTVMDDGKPLLKLGDFGLATHDTWTTDIGTGSDRYMAPEQYECLHDGYSPAQADIWAVGCCLLNLVFSRNAFKVPSTSDPIFADYVRDPMSLCDVFPDMSIDTFDVLKHALTIDPTKRDLEKVRTAIVNVDNWTDSETAEDECPETDFTCYADEPITCTVFNRAPLRTPSLAQTQPFFTTPVDGMPFSWATALQKPLAFSKIDESEDEDEDITDETLSIKDQDHDTDSGLGTSLGSLSITPIHTTTLPRPRFPSKFTLPPVTPVTAPRPTVARKFADLSQKTTSSSVPITSSRGIFGKYIAESSDKLKFGKSWSDWVEEEEDEAEQLSRGDSRGSSASSSRGSSFGEDDGGWWEGVAVGGWED
jgi:serine/threonine protein kinase